jgi:hypothetical protein
MRVQVSPHNYLISFTYTIFFDVFACPGLSSVFLSDMQGYLYYLQSDTSPFRCTKHRWVLLSPHFSPKPKKNPVQRCDYKPFTLDPTGTFSANNQTPLWRFVTEVMVVWCICNSIISGKFFFVLGMIKPTIPFV